MVTLGELKKGTICVTLIVKRLIVLYLSHFNKDLGTVFRFVMSAKGTMIAFPPSLKRI